MSRVKLFLVLPFILFAAALVAKQVTTPEPEKFVQTGEIKFRSVRDFPPISDQSVFYSGSDYTLPDQRSILQLFNTRGLVALDQEFNRYYLPGNVDVSLSTYRLEQSNLGNYRACLKDICIPITEITPGYKFRS